ncbi:phage tail protein [Marinobacterium stanieri]|uniref:Phage tail-collar fibre protein n=1 Tax=Marinobacterium stanieri TaxID=49186 RepID=A0A1N6Q2W5_9GAMM|nr:phage tail protein [Marinobacterium stanieri]SIQ10931.1 Phage tail-collar fibre protein [Marinobacterium stanieri]
MNYYMKVTQSGLAKLAAVTAGGPAVEITQGAIGDGNGAPVPVPDGSETTLINELERYSLNSLFAHPTDPTLVTAEFLVPADIGGWHIREVGLFTSDGELFAYGNFPETYKPTSAEGSTRDMLISAALRVGNSALMTLILDANVTVATRKWVNNTITLAYLLPGGRHHQVLAKASDNDGDTQWVNQISPRTYFMGQN